MREYFSHYYALTPNQLSELSKTALIAFDASFLLDLYRYSPETVSQMFRVLEGLSDQIWVPHQAAHEFHKNRLEVIGRLRSKHEAVLKRCKEDGDRLIKSIEADCAKHPHLEAKEITSPIAVALSEVEKKLHSIENKHQVVTLDMSNDEVWKRLDGLFSGRVGPPYEETILAKHEQDAKIRFDNQIPPGFKDSKKTYPFGDYIVWRQLLDRCKNEAKPAFFVTSDVKEDWWQESMGAKLGALPRLREEFRRETGQEFHLYETTHFVEVFAPKFQVEHQQAVKEINRVQRESRISRETDMRRAEILRRKREIRLAMIGQTEDARKAAQMETLSRARIRRQSEQTVDDTPNSETLLQWLGRQQAEREWPPGAEREWRAEAERRWREAAELAERRALERQAEAERYELEMREIEMREIEEKAMSEAVEREISERMEYERENRALDDEPSED